MAKAYTETKYLITVVNNKDGTKTVHTSDDIIRYLNGSSDIRKNSFWRLLYHKWLSFECDEDYKMFGLPSPNEDWSIIYNMKEMN